MNWFSVLSCWCLRLISDSVHLPDGQAWVKTLFLHEVWLRSGELYASDSSDATRCDPTRSRFRESTSTGAVLSGEDFQNRGTFVVVRSSVFSISSVHNTPLARDAYNALWDSRRRSQERNCSRSAWL